MNTTAINFRTAVNTKNQFKQLAEEFGLSISALLNALMKQAVRVKRVELELTEKPSEYMIKALKESEEDFKNGDYYSFDNAEKAAKFLEKM